MKKQFDNIMTVKVFSSDNSVYTNGTGYDYTYAIEPRSNCKKK